jgi:hypothetical protein
MNSAVEIQEYLSHAIPYSVRDGLAFIREEKELRPVEIDAIERSIEIRNEKGFLLLQNELRGLRSSSDNMIVYSYIMNNGSIDMFFTYSRIGKDREEARYYLYLIKDKWELDSFVKAYVSNNIRLLVKELYSCHFDVFQPFFDYIIKNEFQNKFILECEKENYLDLVAIFLNYSNNHNYSQELKL